MANSTQQETPRASRTWLFRLLVVSIPVLSGLLFTVWLLVQRGWLVAEDGGFAFRRPPMILEEPGHELTGHRYLYDETLGWRNIPNWQATTFGKPLTINSQGMRSPREFSSPKPDGTKRVLVLGDSYVWGYGVADDQLFTELLQAKLDSRTSKWEVLNTGVSGWGTDQQFLYLKNEGLSFKPDIVVVAFFIGNDIDNNAAATQYELNKPVFVDRKLTLENVPVPRPGFRIDPYIEQKLGKLDPVQHSVDIIAGIAATCRELDIELVLMKFGIFLAPKLPYALDLQRRFDSARRAAALDLHYLDLDERFVAENLDLVKLTEGVDDGHWNALGHARVAEFFEAYLQDQSLLSD